MLLSDLTAREGPMGTLLGSAVPPRPTGAATPTPVEDTVPPSPATQPMADATPIHDPTIRAPHWPVNDRSPRPVVVARFPSVPPDGWAEPLDLNIDPAPDIRPGPTWAPGE